MEEVQKALVVISKSRLLSGKLTISISPSRKCLAPSHLSETLKSLYCPGSPEKRVNCQLDTCEKTGTNQALDNFRLS